MLRSGLAESSIYETSSRAVTSSRSEEPAGSECRTSDTTTTCIILEDATKVHAHHSTSLVSRIRAQCVTGACKTHLFRAKAFEGHNGSTAWIRDYGHARGLISL